MYDTLQDPGSGIKECQQPRLPYIRNLRHISIAALWKHTDSSHASSCFAADDKRTILRPFDGLLMLDLRLDLLTEHPNVVYKHTLLMPLTYCLYACCLVLYMSVSTYSCVLRSDLADKPVMDNVPDPAGQSSPDPNWGLGLNTLYKACMWQACSINHSLERKIVLDMLLHRILMYSKMMPSCCWLTKRLQLL